jgi:hypothetical protein
MQTKHFENVKNQIGFCGIWCGSCVVGNGILREFTKRYDKLINDYDLKEWAPRDFDFNEFAKGLKSIQDMPLCEGCLKGGGRPNCEIRSCARSKNIEDCSQCDQQKACKNTEILQTMRTGALRADLMVKVENVDGQKLIDMWTSELKNRWPFCILFSQDQ